MPLILQFLAPKARQTELRGGLSLLPRSCARQEPLSADVKMGLQMAGGVHGKVSRDSLAEWSKALASGASP